MPTAFQPIGFVRFVIRRGFEIDFQFRQEIRVDLIGFGLSERALGDQFFDINFARCRLALDVPIHNRLSERRFVALVVAVAAIAHHVDHDVLAEFLAEFRRDFGHMCKGFDVVAVDVENRRQDHLGHIGAIDAGA